MANNILIDQGSTTTLGTDDCAGTHISLVKLVNSTEDSTTRTGVAGDPLHVQGTITANLSATDNAVLDAIEADTTSIDTKASTIIGHVDGIEALLTTIDTDTGAIVGHVDGIEGLLTTIDTDTGAIVGHVDGIETLLGTIDADTSSIAGAISGSEMQVDVVTMPGLVGTIADDATTPGSPVMVGGFMKNFDGTTPGIVSAEDDVVRFITDPNRRQYVNTVHPQFWSYHSDGSSALTDASVQGAPASGYAIFVTDIIFSIGAATACNIFFEEGSTKVLGPYYLEAIAGRGLVLKFTTPKQITAATALTVTTSAAIAQGLDVMGFIAKV